MYFAFLVEVVKPEEKLSTDDCDVTFVEGTGFQLIQISGRSLMRGVVGLYQIQA